MGKANPNYFPGEQGNRADVGNSIIDDYRESGEEQEEPEEPEQCPACGDEVPDIDQLYNEELEAYLHVGCFKKEVSEE